MKKFVFFLFLILFPCIVNASSAYIKNFEVLNGKLSIPFQEKNNIYTIYLNEGANTLEYIYELEDENASVEILNQEYIEGIENVATIKVIDEQTKETQMYTFYLEKEKTQSVSLDLTNVKALEPQKEIPYLKEITIGICSILIFFFFRLLIWNFYKKNKHR